MAERSIATNDNSTAIEVALVGREGAIGGIVSNGSVPAYATAQVRFGGHFFAHQNVGPGAGEAGFYLPPSLVLPLFGLPGRAAFSDSGMQRDPHHLAKGSKNGFSLQSSARAIWNIQ